MSKDRKLARSVDLYTEDEGIVVYQAGDVPSDDHAKLITNPAAWEEDDSLAENTTPDFKERVEVERTEEGFETNPVSEDPQDNLEYKTVRQLQQFAADHNYDVSGAGNKSDLLDRIREAQEASVEEEEVS